MRITLTIFVILLAFTPKLLAQVDSLADAQSRSSQTLAEWTKDFTVTTVPKYGVPTCLLTFKPEAIPVFQTNSFKCGTYGVAVFVGQGRIAAFGHNGYWFSNAILKTNVVNWAGQGQISDAQVLSLQNINEDSFLTRDLSAYKVLVWPGTPEYKSNEALDKLETFVRNGGGLISAYAGWVWTAYGGFSNELEVSTNKFLMRFGVLNTVNYLSGSNQGLSYAPVIENINSLYAFRAGLSNSDRVSAFSQALERLPIDVFNSVSDFNDFMNTGDENLSFPILKGNDQSKYRAVYLTKKYSNVNTPKALSGISSVPGVVSSAERLTVEVTVTREISDSWLSTGYYLAAGEVLTITAKTPIQNWHVRIGCHSDSINHKDNWPRYPSITRQEKLSSTVHRITSPFGGLIYLVSSGSSCTSITVELSNVVRAAFYDVNNPAANNWDLNAAAPMAEIQGLYLTMSVPLSGIQRVSNPQAVADYYDKVIAEMHRVRSTVPGRRERFVGDIEISAGWMHSGYPIMTYLSIVTSTTGVPLQMDVDGVLKSGSWGHFHEVGHNLQRGWWTIDGAGEVTNNIFSLLGGYICCNIPVLENSWIKGKYNSTLLKLNDYINRSTNDTYNWLKSDPGIFLVQYALLIHEFGWETYRMTFAAYESSSGPRPSSNQDKIDVWIRELSRAAQRNLLPYFELWRMPISDAGISGVNALGLSPWLPNNSVFPYKNINADYFNSIRTKYGL